MLYIAFLVLYFSKIAELGIWCLFHFNLINFSELPKLMLRLYLKQPKLRDCYWINNNCKGGSRALSVICKNHLKQYNMLTYTLISRSKPNQTKLNRFILLPLPVLNTKTEKSFSTLTRLKTYRRNAVDHGRLNRLTILLYS